MNIKNTIIIMNNMNLLCIMKIMKIVIIMSIMHIMKIMNILKNIFIISSKSTLNQFYHHSPLCTRPFEATVSTKLL